jgi:hypothetical protein
LLTNAIVVDDAIRFVSQQAKDKERINHLQIIAMKITNKNQASMTIMKMKIARRKTRRGDWRNNHGNYDKSSFLNSFTGFDNSMLSIKKWVVGIKHFLR